MGKTRNSGLGFGAGTSPQGNLMQSFVDQKINKLAKEIEAKPEVSKEEMFSLLDEAGVKYNPDDVIFVTKDKTGQLVWLETGNRNAGLEHILNGEHGNDGHADHFKKAFGIEPEQIAGFLNEIISKGKVISSELKHVANRMGYERTYYYNDGYYVITAIGENGFLVSAYPKKKGK